MSDDVFKTSMMLDFYGQLITKKQYDVIDLHYNSDYSLSEISEHIGITRQGVYDNIKNGMSALEKFEDKLGLVVKYLERTHIIQDVFEKLDQLTINDEDTRIIIASVKSDLKKML